MTDPQTTRPTAMAERTLFAVTMGFNGQALLFGLALLLPVWPDVSAAERIHYLGWDGLISALGNFIIVVGMMSPWIGSVSVKGLGAEVHVAGDQVSPADSTAPSQST